MELTKTEEKILDRVKSDLEGEQVAGPDHIERMTCWCQRLGPDAGADMEVLTAGALVHDVGVVIDRKTHYLVGRAKAAEILKEVGFPGDKVDQALHVLEAHSRYGGPEPRTVEAKIARDADALEYIGAIGILRAVIRGLNDGSFDGNVSNFPEFLRSLLVKIKGGFCSEQAEDIARSRIEFMNKFLRRIEKELEMEA